MFILEIALVHFICMHTQTYSMSANFNIIVLDIFNIFPKLQEVLG